MHQDMSVLAFCFTGLPNPDIGKGCTLGPKPIPCQLHIRSKRFDRIGDASRLKMNGRVPIERTVFFRCKTAAAMMF